MRNRQKQRELHRKQTREKMIDKSNYCGVKDLTAYNAVMRIRTNGKDDNPAPLSSYDAAEILRKLFEERRHDKTGHRFITNEGQDYPF